LWCKADIAYLGAEAAVGGHLNLQEQLLSASQHAGETPGIKKAECRSTEQWWSCSELCFQNGHAGTRVQQGFDNHPMSLNMRILDQIKACEWDTSVKVFIYIFMYC
jgi:hypothetical protein